jgi:hypothetical protein
MYKWRFIREITDRNLLENMGIRSRSKKNLMQLLKIEVINLIGSFQMMIVICKQLGLLPI